ncbi:class I SAM-dependent methyltransferase [candidate division FCPU426 bacterium]|nr:class I SAM-dependent methyltransferase [candidate division FCPU426 bacterium]
MAGASRVQQALAQLSLRPSEKVYLRRLLRRVEQYFQPGMQVLDAGCGDGKPAEVLAALGCRVTGVDIQAHPERWQALGQKGVRCQEASAEQLPFGNGQFDAVWIKDTFHHVRNPGRAMRELQRVTRPGGSIVVVEANRYNPVFYVHLTLFGNHQHFSQRFFRRFLQAADPQYVYGLAESRCLPWDAAWLLAILDGFEEILERIQVCNWWLTYQIGVVKGNGR